jgi:hypothetical protein
MTADGIALSPNRLEDRTVTRQTFSTVKLLVVFLVAFSLASLSGALSGPLHLPSVLLGHAIPEPCVDPPQCLVQEYWYPAGAAMDTLQTPIFGDSTAELTCLQLTPPCVDLTDSSLPPALISSLQTNPNLYVTLPVSKRSYLDIQFLLINNFWGCNFNFGNSTCGVQIRQGIAHMLDKAKFAATDPSIAGIATAVDNPVPPINGGLESANPCAWDANFTQSGPNCFVGAPGGLSYHLANATGADGIAWLQAPGSVDLNAAAQHFVNAGLATGYSSTTSILTGINPATLTHAVNFFIRNDDTARLDLGNGLAAQICYLFTGSYATPCQYLSVTRAPITAFPGFCTSSCCPGPGLTTCSTGPSLSWGMYTGGFTDIYPFDASLYFIYNSKFVSSFPSIVSPNGPCSNGAVASSEAANYMFLCNPAYDSLSSQMEFAPCLYAPVEPPLPGTQIPNSDPNPCTGTTQFSAFNMGLQSENLYGKNAYSIPAFDVTRAQYAYAANWQRVITADGVGIPNFFTWLDAYNPNPTVPGTIRQGFASSTRSVSPYAAETVHDSYIVQNIYDSLTIENPRAASQNPSAAAQTIDWMVTGVQQNLPPSALTYQPPPGTTQTFRFTLRSDLFFQDARKVTAFDVAFSYLSLKGTGALAGGGADPVTGITILGPLQFDINLSGVGPFTLASLTGLPILPGRYWSNAGASAWDSAVNTCTATNAPCYPAQYTIVPSAPTTTACALTCVFPATDMNTNLAQTSATYDPIANHTLVGSGPWECGPVASSGSSTTCSSSSTENPPVNGYYTLSRFGKGIAPASSISSIYFRSGGNLALWTWSQNTGDITHDFLNFSIVASCFNSLSLTCLHWMMGIGGCGGSPQNPCTIGLNQIAEVGRFIGIGWVAPFNWQSSPPTGLVPPAPTIYEDGFTLQPASIAGCSLPFPNSGYDC